MHPEIEVLLIIFLKSIQKRRKILIDSLLKTHTNILNSVVKDRRIKKRSAVYQVNLRIPRIFFDHFQPRFRGFRSLIRTDSFWRNLQQPLNERLYFESFRMRSETFYLLCQKLKPFLGQSSCFVQPPLPVEKQVAVCLYKLATCAEYKCVGDAFGIHKSTVHKYFHLVVHAINQLKNELIQFPNLETALAIANKFEQKCNIPNIIGAIDGTHIPILAPLEGYLDYVNRKGWTSLVMQGVVDNNYMFIDVAIKHPGSAHDALVFKESSLFKKSNEKIPRHAKIINGIPTPLFLIGDPAYPLLPWLMKPYTGRLTPEEESFNVYLSSARMAIENAFGRLKGRWRCLCKRIDVDPKFVPHVVLACTILHNFVEKNKESYVENWTSQAQILSSFNLQPETTTTIDVITDNSPIRPKALRDNLKAYLKDNFPLLRSHLH